MSQSTQTLRVPTPEAQPGPLTRLGMRLFGGRRNLQTNLTLSLMALPGILMLLVFAYLPMVGLVIAFKDYRFVDGIWGSDWVGFDNFRFLFGTDTAWRITRNTLLMNSLFIATSTVASLGIALLMNEVYTSWLSKYYQTMLFFPYFISWVIVSYFVFGFLNGETGIANQVLTALGMDKIEWYREPTYWPSILTAANLWNGMGFGSIVYLAGMLGIDTTYYEAAKIDGANKWQQIRYITLPLILPGVLAGMILSFARALGEFGATITFVSNIPGETQTIPTAIYFLVQEPGGEVPALRLTLVSVAISMAALFASEALTQRTARRALGN